MGAVEDFESMLAAKEVPLISGTADACRFKEFMARPLQPRKPLPEPLPLADERGSDA